MSRISTYFRTEEFVPKEIFTRFGERSIYFIDRRIVLLADFIRDRFGKVMTINNWHSGGNLNYRGFRPRSCEIGGELSQHRFKAAIDFNIEGKTSQEIYKDVIDNQDMYMKAGVTTIEDIAFTATWIHVDIRYTALEKILIVKP